jgi:ABC-type transporter Mla maintaining outer membrane lipid asymmetry ATPase subunit MlaF
VITGATLPERGEVRLFGRSTSAISEGAEWLSLVDRFGIVSERAVLLDQFSVIQNLAVPFTLEIEPPPGDVRDRAIALAREVGIAESSFDRPVAHLRPAGRARLRLGRALALDPAILILEHASAVARRRGAAILALTADRQFADAVARRVLTHDAATGRLSEQRGWLSRRRGA